VIPLTYAQTFISSGSSSLAYLRRQTACSHLGARITSGGFPQRCFPVLSFTFSRLTRELTQKPFGASKSLEKLGVSGRGLVNQKPTSNYSSCTPPRPHVRGTNILACHTIDNPNVIVDSAPDFYRPYVNPEKPCEEHRWPEHALARLQVAESRTTRTRKGQDCDAYVSIPLGTILCAVSNVIREHLNEHRMAKYLVLVVLTLHAV
jgi:hypothetical protein